MWASYWKSVWLSSPPFKLHKTDARGPGINGEITCFSQSPQSTQSKKPILKILLILSKTEVIGQKSGAALVSRRCLSPHSKEISASPLFFRVLSEFL